MQQHVILSCQSSLFVIISRLVLYHGIATKFVAFSLPDYEPSTLQ